MAEDKDGKNGESKGEMTKSEPKPALVASGNRNVGAIIPENIEQAFRLAQAVCAANMAPKAYNRDVNAVMVGMLHGMEVGLTPMASLQSIAVINGMPTIWGDGALALVRSSGLLEDFDERMEGDGDEMAAVCELKRKGEKSKKIERFSVARAKKAGLWGKAGPWTQYPERMLQMRARSFALRDKFADVLRGLHVAEEVRDMGELVPGQDGTYAPQRPLREKYLDEDYQRRMDAARKRSEEKQAEEDEARMNAEARGAMGGHTLADEETGAEADQGGTDGAPEPEEGGGGPRAEPAESGAQAAPEPGEAGNGKAAEVPAGGKKAEPAKAKVASQPPAEANGKVNLVDGTGKVVGSYTGSIGFFGSLQSLIVQADNGQTAQAVLESNRSAAEHLIARFGNKAREAFQQCEADAEERMRNG